MVKNPFSFCSSIGASTKFNNLSIAILLIIISFKKSGVPGNIFKKSDVEENIVGVDGDRLTMRDDSSDVVVAGQTQTNHERQF